MKIYSRLYQKNGYEIMIINENDFSRTKMNTNIVNNCVEFLRNEI